MNNRGKTHESSMKHCMKTSSYVVHIKRWRLQPSHLLPSVTHLWQLVKCIARDEGEEARLHPLYLQPIHTTLNSACLMILNRKAIFPSSFDILPVILACVNRSEGPNNKSTWKITVRRVQASTKTWKKLSSVSCEFTLKVKLKKYTWTHNEK